MVQQRAKKVFSKARTAVKSQIVFHTLSVGHVVVLCSRKHFQVCYSISKCFVSLYYIKNQQDATLAVLFINHCKITLRVSDAESVRNTQSDLAVINKQYGQSCILLVLYIIEFMVDIMHYNFSHLHNGKQVAHQCFHTGGLIFRNRLFTRSWRWKYCVIPQQQVGG